MGGNSERSTLVRYILLRIMFSEFYNSSLFSENLMHRSIQYEYPLLGRAWGISANLILHILMIVDISTDLPRRGCM